MEKPNLFRLDVVWADIVEITHFIPVTLELTFFSMIIGLVLGFIIAVVRMKKIPVIQQITTVFISIIRGTPIIVQLYVIYFGIPIGIQYYNYYHGTEINTKGMAAVLYAIIALGINTSALCAVTIQSALEAVNKGEIEAARTLGMTGAQVIKRIIVPEAIELALPSLGNTLIGLIKGTSLAFTCAVIEMTAQSKIIGARSFRNFEAYVAVGLLYWLITICLEQIIALIIRLVQVPESPKSVIRKKTEVAGA